jgi:hypothetical protein
MRAPRCLPVSAELLIEPHTAAEWPATGHPTAGAAEAYIFDEDPTGTPFQR